MKEAMLKKSRECILYLTQKGLDYPATSSPALLASGQRLALVTTNVTTSGQQPPSAESRSVRSSVSVSTQGTPILSSSTSAGPANGTQLNLNY